MLLHNPLAPSYPWAGLNTLLQAWSLAGREFAQTSACAHFFLQRLMVMLSNRCEDRNGAALTVEAVIVSLSTMRTTASGLQDLSALATREVGPREHARGSRWMSFFLLNQGLQLTLLLSPFLELLLLMRI